METANKIGIELTAQAGKDGQPAGPDSLRNAYVLIAGKTIPLAYDLRTQIVIDEEIGMNYDELWENINKLKKNTNTKTVVQAIRIMGNRGLEKAGEKADLTDDWLMDHIVMRDMLVYKAAMLLTLMNGWYMETDDSDEKEVDVGLMEIRKKNGSTE